MKSLFLAATLAFAALPALAAGLDQPLPDPAQEAKARAIAKEIRCLVCQNESIDESNADLAADLRRIVRERVAAGDDEAAVKRYLVERYGEWVLLRPPFEPSTWALWFGPAAILLVAGGAIWLRRRRPAPAEAAPAPLSAEEEARLAELMKDGDRS
ncbi:cytochrome c-type biogenesis protein [Zavarzinia sp.]|uniref:cytochrome c-type biogenesis protein n=1 Tax=Zavarzinia sp. TaxID=2027920 RepID=UPI00356426AA